MCAQEVAQGLIVLRSTMAPCTILVLITAVRKIRRRKGCVVPSKKLNFK